MSGFRSHVSHSVDDIGFDQKTNKNDRFQQTPDSHTSRTACNFVAQQTKNNVTLVKLA